MNELWMEKMYAKTEKWLYNIVHSFRKKYGGDFDDLLEESYDHFMRACVSFIPEKGAFTTHLWWRVYNGLKETWKKNNQRTRKEDCVLKDHPHNARGFNLKAFLFELSDEAAAVIKMVLESPGEICPSTVPRYKKRAVMKHLLRLGWAADQIIRVFREIREALA